MVNRPFSMYLPRPLDRVAQLRRGEVLGAADVEDDLLAPRDEVDGGGELRDGVGGGEHGAGLVRGGHPSLRGPHDQNVDGRAGPLPRPRALAGAAAAPPRADILL